MGWIRDGWERLRTLIRLGREEADMDEEMRFHLEMEARKLESQGLEPEEARREALRRFGGVERMKERARDERGTRLVEDTVRDLAYAVRGIRRAPGFAAVALVTLVVGIGSTTAMYTLVDGVLLEPLPYPASHRLVSVWEETEEGGRMQTSYLNFADWRSAASQVSGLAAFTGTRTATVLTPAGGVRARLTSVTADFFEVAGMDPLVGRVPSPEEHRPGASPVAVVSEGFWRGELVEAPLAGLTVNVDGTIYEVVGVMPARLKLPESSDVWVSLDRVVPWTVRGNHVVGVLGRLSPGATVEGLDQELDGVHARLGATYPEVETPEVQVRSYLDEVVGDVGRALVLLLAASAILLLVACTNLAGTMLARGTGRLRELAIRTSLGAGRGRLVRQLSLEGLTLALAGAAGGALVAVGLLELARTLDPGAVPRLAEVSLDGGALAFSTGMAVLSALLFGLLPALVLTRGDLAGSMRSGRGGPGRGARTAWRVVMGAEVALAVVLLVSGGLVARSLGEILQRDGGFKVEEVVVGRIALPLGKYDEGGEVVAALDRMLEAVRAGRGISSAGLGFLLPVPGQGRVAGPIQLPDGTTTEGIFSYRVADAGYFRTLAVPLVLGRLFDGSDGPDAPHVAVVDEAMARRLWPGEDPVGKTFRTGGMDPFPDEPLIVVGVVGETVRWDQDAGSDPGYYVHYAQRPTFVALFGGHLVAASRDADGAATHLRRAVRGVDRDVPIQVATLAARVAGSAAERRFAAFVMAAFAMVALFLAAVGVYGVVSYAVARRTREMGIRMALGASRSRVRGTVQRDALITVAVGGVAGVAGALLASRALESLLFGVSPADPASFGGALLLLMGAAWTASWIPAWRGTRLQPVEVMRHE